MNHQKVRKAVHPTVSANLNICLTWGFFHKKVDRSIYKYTCTCSVVRKKPLHLCAELLLLGRVLCLIYQALGFPAWTTLIPESNYSVLVAGLPAAHKTRLLPCGSVLM